MRERPQLLKQFQGLFVDPHDAATNAASFLFQEIEVELGRPAARRIFAKFGTPPSARKLAMLKNFSLLDRLDMMKPKPNVKKLARELAEENKELPTEQRRGPGSTNPETLERHIRTLLAERKINPYWPQRVG
jgi:hypothetical protein